MHPFIYFNVFNVYNYIYNSTYFGAEQMQLPSCQGWPTNILAQCACYECRCIQPSPRPKDFDTSLHPRWLRPSLTAQSEVSMLPRVGPFSTMKLSRPVRMVETDHAGFQVSGWKSVMDKHNLWRGGGYLSSLKAVKSSKKNKKNKTIRRKRQIRKRIAAIQEKQNKTNLGYRIITRQFHKIHNVET